MKKLWSKYSLGFVIGAVGITLSFASIESRVTDDRALYENLKEIRVAKTKDVNFDSDINALARLEDRYREKLPLHQEKARVSSAKKRWKNTRATRKKTTNRRASRLSGSGRARS